MAETETELANLTRRLAAAGFEREATTRIAHAHLATRSMLTRKSLVDLGNGIKLVIDAVASEEPGT